MSAAENYMRRFMVGTANDRYAIGVLEGHGVFAGLHFDLIQRFLLGIALRGHFATPISTSRVLLPAI